MNNKLFVGNLPYSTDDAALQAHFAQAGTVESATVIMDKFTGRSRGFGFVVMSTPEEAQAAIDMLDSKELDGREIKVNIAKPREDRA